jgi:hypothetical protein
MDNDKFAPQASDDKSKITEPVRTEPVETKTETTEVKLPTYTPTPVAQPVATPAATATPAPAQTHTPMTNTAPVAPATTPTASATPTVSSTTSTVKKSGKNSAIWIIVLILLVPVLCCVFFFCGTFIFAAMSESSSNDSGENITYDTPTPTKSVSNSNDDDITVSTPTPTASTTRIASPVLRPTETPPAGFTWYSCSTISAWSLRPSGWFVLEETKDSVYSCYITKERISSTQQFETGLTISVYTGVQSRYGTKPSLHAKTVSDNLAKLGTVSGLQPVTDEDFNGYSQFLSSKVGEIVVNQYIAILGNDAANKLYVIAFESRDNVWDTNWTTYGKVMIPEVVIPLD